jgi:hypothetical protein
MKCPECQQEMQIRSKDLSNNQNKGDKYKEYQRILYWCEEDDVWISVETPLTTT